MFATDKIKIRLQLFVRTFIYQLVFWYAGFLFYLFLTGDQSLFHLPKLTLGDFLEQINIVNLSLLTATMFTLGEGFFSDRLMRFLPRTLSFLLKAVLYFALVLMVLSFLGIVSVKIGFSANKPLFELYLPKTDVVYTRFLVYFIFLSILNGFFTEVVKKIGPGNFKNWIFGVLDKPREEERIFMFIDLKSSTSIAEKLGHKKFSHLVQDVFNDMAIVYNYNGEIYQYMGDGAIISWEVKHGLKHLNFLKSFFAFEQVIKRRRRYYQRKYALEPKFKAGVHVGKVMVLQVGKIRRDISYNGDTMNTAARIESKCNELKNNLLISANLQALIGEQKTYRLSNVGEISLRGKRKPVELFGVKQKIKR